MIDMTTVNQIEHNIPSRVYYRYIYITSSAFLSKDSHVGNAIYAIPVFSKTKVQWTDISGQLNQPSTAGLYTFLDNCGYSPTVGQSYNQIQLFADNMSEICISRNSEYCPTASISARTTGLSLFYAIPEGTAASVSTSVSITSPYDWQLYYEETGTQFYSSRISYLYSTAGSYTRLDITTPYAVSPNMQDLVYLIQENLLEVKSFVYNGESYNPQDVSITYGMSPDPNTVRVDVYDGVNTFTIDLTSSDWFEYFYADPSGYKQVAAILGISGNILWGNVGIYGYHIKVGSYYINRGTGSNLITNANASTVWHIETDNRIYCLDGNTKRYLKFQTSGSTHPVYADTTTGSGYDWVYKNGSYIKGTISGTAYYLYRYSTGAVRMHTSSTSLTFEEVGFHTPDWHTIWEGDYSITCEAINGQMVKHPESTMVVYHVPPKISSLATAYSDMQIKVYYQFDWIGNRGDTTPGNSTLTEYTVSDLSSDKNILNIPVNPIDSNYSLIDFVASTVDWDATRGNIIFYCRGILHPDDTQYFKSVIRITKIELYC